MGSIGWLPIQNPETPGLGFFSPITIDYGKVPKELASASDYGIAWQADSERHLLSISEVARYLVVNDSDILIDPMPGSTEDDIRPFLLGSVFGAVLHARKIDRAADISTTQHKLPGNRLSKTVAAPGSIPADSPYNRCNAFNLGFR